MSLIHVLYNVTCRPRFRQRPKYAHATIEKVLQRSVFYVVNAMPITKQRVVHPYPQKQTSGTIGHLLLGNKPINTHS
jgi:trehalose utilization protein